MKKFSAIILTVIVLCLSVCPAIISVSAAGDDDWVLAPNAAYITHGDKTYYPINTVRYFQTDYSIDYWGESLELEYADRKTKERYDDSCVYIGTGADDVAVQVELFEDDYYFTEIYVEESYMQEFADVADGIADKYITYNYYDLATFDLDADTYNEWVSSETLTVNARTIDYYDWYYIYACDSSEVFNTECGMILRDYYTDEVYLLRYSDYDRTYFYSDGTFDTSNNIDVTLYKLEDETFRQELLNFYDTMPEDDLDWLVTDEVNESVALVFCSAVFGVLPLALVIFSVIMLFVIKDKKYRRPFIVLSIGSVFILLAFASVLLILI